MIYEYNNQIAPSLREWLMTGCFYSPLFFQGMQQMTDKMPDEIYVSRHTAYYPNEVFNINPDGVLLARDAHELVKYIRADLVPTTLPPKEFDAFMKRLDEPPKVLPNLAKLLNDKPLWEDDSPLNIVTEPTGDVAKALDGINYNLDDMPSGDFVGECYMLTHDIIKALGNYNLNPDRIKANEQFMSAEKIIRNYVWKSCIRALTQQPDAELFGRMLHSLKKMQEYVSGTCDYLAVRDELDKSKEVIREAEAITLAEQKGGV